jgi:hypothetical protein
MRSLWGQTLIVFTVLATVLALAQRRHGEHGDL